MTAMTPHTFECRMYVPARGPLKYKLPAESGPRHVARLQPLDYDQLFDPGFRRLLAAFESIPQSPLAVQV